MGGEYLGFGLDIKAGLPLARELEGWPKIMSLAPPLIFLWRTPSDSLTKRLDAASLAKYVKKNLQLG